MRQIVRRQGYRRVVAGLVVGLALAGHPGTSAAAGPTRYSLANGCYALRSASGAVVPGGERLRMQATGLGSYLLYLPDRTFLAAQSGGGVAPAAEPSPAADWKVTEAAGKFNLAPASGGATLASVTFSPADGCAVFPEAERNATGTPRKNVPFGRLGGLVEGRMHWMTFEYLG